MLESTVHVISKVLKGIQDQDQPGALKVLSGKYLLFGVGEKKLPY